MSNNNETVEQVCEKMRDWVSMNGRFNHTMFEFADRILAAYNREIDAIAAQKTAEAHEAFVKNAELAEAIAAKDAEIEDLKKENARLRVINCGSIYADGNLREEIERLREIVKELADELETMICDEIVKSSKRSVK